MFKAAIRAPERNRASLHGNFAATFTGNAIFAACQWAVLSAVARLGGPEALGEYALAIAIATPVALLFHLNLRAVLATDMKRVHAFGDHLTVRLWTAAAGMAVIAAMAFTGGYKARVPALIFAAGLVLTADNLSDLYYGALQRRDRMRQIAISTAARGALSLVALTATLWATGSILAAVGAQLAARLSVLLLYDRVIGGRGESHERNGIKAQGAIFRSAAPLGVVLTLLSLAGNLPRYVVENKLGTAELGFFAAAASFASVGSTVVNALGHAATPRLARYFHDGNLRKFRKLALELIATSGALGLAGFAVALVAGRLALLIVYGSRYQSYDRLLVWMMVAGALGYISGSLGYIMTSAREFDSQLPIFCLVAACSGVVSWFAIPRFGLNGAAIALSSAWIVQGAGAWIVLRRALRNAVAEVVAV